MKRLVWKALDAGARADALARPRPVADRERAAEVARLIAMVRADGDVAVRALTRRFDGVELGDSRVPPEAFDEAEASLDAGLKAAIDASYDRIRRFHEAQRLAPVEVETAPGLRCMRIVVPIARVGLYVPAGTAPLPSTALMLGVPAQLAGCETIVLCTPPRPDGRCDPAVLYAARRCGIERVHAVGGVQAIAAMAYGTESIPKCDKVFGPGNAWVTEAKQQVALDPAGAAIDLPAGPSEVLVIADDQANPAFVAADLLSQAEHGADSQVMLVSDSPALLDAVLAEIDRQLAALPRREVASRALAESRAILVDTLDEALSISNDYAPEHLILAVAEPRRALGQVRNAGSVFLGGLTPESLGDYTSGTNHVLPTNGFARAWSGLSLASFQKTITVQEASADGLRAVGPDAIAIARAEGLVAHERAVSIRLAALEGGVA
jgi:histidinol dehydrogenase